MKRLVDMDDNEIDDRGEQLRALAEALRPTEDSELRAARVARSIDAVPEERAAPSTRLRLAASVAMLAVLLVTVVAAAMAVARYRERPTASPVPEARPSLPSVQAAPRRAVEETPAPPPSPAAAPLPPQRVTSSTAIERAPTIERTPDIGRAPVIDPTPIVVPRPAPPAAAPPRSTSATKLPLDEDEPTESPIAEVAAHIAGAGSSRRLPDAPSTSDSGGESWPLLRAVGSLRRGDPALAATFVEEYLRDHPDGACVEEAYALGIDAARRRGDPGGRALATRYLRRFPDGRYARFAERTLRRLTGSSESPAPTPQ